MGYTQQIIVSIMLTTVYTKKWQIVFVHNSSLCMNRGCKKDKCTSNNATKHLFCLARNRIGILDTTCIFFTTCDRSVWCLSCDHNYRSELFAQQESALAEKKRLRKILRDFESDFLSEHGRCVHYYSSTVIIIG